MIAHKTTLPVISIDSSILPSGENTNGRIAQLVNALFSVAKEKQPCVIFIDSMENLFGATGNPTFKTL